MRRLGFPALAVLTLFAAFLAVALPAALDRSIQRVQRAARLVGETPLEERRRVWGDPHALAIEEIRRVIPADGVYALINGDAVDQGAPIWVRFDLAPRRALLVSRSDLAHPRRARKRLPREVRWVVVSSHGKTPELIERSRLLRNLENLKESR